MVKQIYIWDKRRMLRRSALIIGADPADTFLRDGRWQPLGQATRHIRVDGVQHASRHEITTGHILSLFSDKQERLATILITGIRLVRRDHLSPSDLKAAGFASLDDFRENGNTSARMLWYYEFDHVPEDLIGIDEINPSRQQMRRPAAGLLFIEEPRAS